MKRIFAQAAACLLIVCLTACGGKTAPGAASPQAAASSAQGPQTPTAAQGRDEHSTLEMTVEGQTERIAATLYAEDGWSIYIPDEGWRLETDTEPEDREVAWESAVNDESELSVRVWPGMGEKENPTEALFAAFEKDEDDFSFTAQDNVLAGTDSRNGETMAVYPFFSADGKDGFTVAIRYPADAAEGFGARLPVLAATFQSDR